MQQRPDESPANLGRRQRAPSGVVVVYAPGASGRARDHETVTRTALARRLAALMGLAFEGEYDPARRYPGRVYFVPGDTLVGAETAARLGIGGERDLFGAVVPYPCVATKAITHELVEPTAPAPPGWSPRFGRRVRGAVLDGYAAFTPEDARRAGARLLGRGAVRVKPARARGGRGQQVVSDPAELAAALEAIAPDELANDGVVLEENLAEVTTCSVGQVRLAGRVVTYYGTQRLTPDNDGLPVYGGSRLTVARGGFDALLGLGLPDDARQAVAQARSYDTAARECFAGLFASRRNYDVAQGRAPSGRRRSGVLEQSWRIGGASGAEIAALEAFEAEPALRVVRASTVEVYGPCQPPDDATVCFSGVDREVGPITKYSRIERDADP
jgi:Protein of unknown function (DUF3182)